MEEGAFSPLPRTRGEAKARGAKYFFTGQPCKYGHIALRYTKAGSCLECHAKIYIPRWYKENSEKHRAINRRYYRKHAEKMKRRAQAWREAHPDRVKAYNEKYTDPSYKPRPRKRAKARKKKQEQPTLPEGW